MPTYEYRCAKCEEHLEVYQSFSEEPLTKHKGCGGRLTKVMSAAGIVLKGSGFYKTDNRSGSSSKSSSSSSSSSESSSESSSGNTPKESSKESSTPSTSAPSGSDAKSA